MRIFGHVSDSRVHILAWLFVAEDFAPSVNGLSGKFEEKVGWGARLSMPIKGDRGSRAGNRTVDRSPSLCYWTTEKLLASTCHQAH